jgi:hypothetical protein
MNEEWLELRRGGKEDQKWSHIMGRFVRYHLVRATVISFSLCLHIRIYYNGTGYILTVNKGTRNCTSTNVSVFTHQATKIKSHVLKGTKLSVRIICTFYT